MKKYFLLLLVPAVFVLSGCGETNMKNPASEGVGKSGKNLSYPTLYTQESLPQYSDAKLVQIISDGPTLKEGVLLRLESSKDVKTISAYYDDQMAKLGWTMPAVNTPTEASYATQYEKGAKYIQMTVSSLDSKTQTITLSLMQK